ncbi:MAG: efflux RND transporter periplasmic adaptor subunit [Kiritimatiellae bacterium]|nr:efflux RND transporter periplasmic adaptor subunit [Kiritimatiellia bacterium]
MSEEKKEEGSVAAKIGAIVGWLLTAVACGAAGWIGRELWPEEKAAPQQQALPPATIATTNVQMRAYNLAERYVAHAEPEQEVDLLPQVDGYIKEIKFREGDTVDEGQVLYVIDDERYQAVVGQREADLAAAQAEAERARRYRTRMETADSRGITQQELDNAISADLNAKAKVKQAEANLVVARYDVNHAVVKAPFKGKIGKSNAHIGDYVSPAKGALAHLVQIDPMRVTFSFTDRSYIAWKSALEDGRDIDRRMRLILPNGNEYTGGEGKFAFDDSTMNASTASITMRLSFPNEGGLLVPNTYLTLLADYRKAPEYPCVPQTAVVDLPGGNQGVWIVKADGTVEARPVKTLGTFEGWVPVTEGVEEGESVVTAGVGKLGNGMKVVNVQPTSNDENDPEHKTYEEREKIRNAR